MRTFVLALLLAFSLSSYATELDQIFDVIKYVETGNKVDAIGDGGKAYGIVQIHQICVADVNRIYGTSYTHEDAFDVVCAKEIFTLYLSAGVKRFKRKYIRNPTESEIVRMWNGGYYSGYKRESTLKYLEKYRYWKNLLSLWNNKNKDNMAVVYLHLTKEENIPYYVGIGKDVSRAYEFKGRNNFWNNTFSKYGIKVQILHKNIKWSKACEIEKELIHFYGRRDLGTGTLVNLTEGGEGVVGNKLSYKQKQHLRNINLGKKLKDSTKDKLSKPVVQLTLDGEEVEVFKSAKEAYIKTGINFRGISYACRGDRKTSGGYRWKFYDKNYEKYKKGLLC